MAVKMLGDANQKWPTSAAILKLLAAAQIHTRNYDASASSLKSALEIDPEDAETHHLMGCAFRRTGRTDDLRQHFRIAHEINPQYPELP